MRKMQTAWVFIGVPGLRNQAKEDKAFKYSFLRDEFSGVRRGNNGTKNLAGHKEYKTDGGNCPSVEAWSLLVYTEE